MNRSLTLGTALLIALSGSAQNWCVPGATWTYNAGLALQGYHQLSYLSDTLINGVPAQVIDQLSSIQYPMPDPPYWMAPYNSYSAVAMITRTEGDVVYLLQRSVWDTLYWFGGSIGDRWYQAHVNDTTCAPFIVQDTGTAVIDGIPLRWLDLNSGNRVYERIGCTWEMFMFCPNWLIDGPMGMRCYSDDDLSYTVPGWTSGCTTLAGVEGQQVAKPGTIHPNPGDEYFKLRLGPGSHSIEVMDATGRIALRQQTIEGQHIIDTSMLPSGFYLVRVDNTPPLLRWVKE